MREGVVMIGAKAGVICFDSEQRTTSQGMQVACRSSEDQGSRFLSRTSRRNAAMPIFY